MTESTLQPFQTPTEDGGFELKKGVYYGVPDSIYHNPAILPAISSTMVRKIIDKTPAHYYYDYLSGEKEPGTASEAMAMGTIYHRLVLEPERDSLEGVVVHGPINRRTKAGKEEWAKLMETVTEGDILISEERLKDVKEMATKAREVPLVRRLFSGGKSEVTAIWKGPYGLWLKARPDYVHDGLKVLVDLKSTQDASAREAARSAWKFGYHVQDLHYRKVMAGATGSPDWSFIFVFGEKTPPYCSAPYTFDEESLVLAEQQWDTGLKLIARCMETGKWPGYADEITDFELPYWAKRQAREDLKEVNND